MLDTLIHELVTGAITIGSQKTRRLGSVRRLTIFTVRISARDNFCVAALSSDCTLHYETATR